MPGTRVHSDAGHIPGVLSYKIRPRRCLILACVGLVSLLSSGCPTPLPLQLPPGISQPMQVPQAQQLLKEALLRALNPEILEVEIDTDFVIYHYRPPGTVSTTIALTERRIALLNIGRVEAFSNNLVLIWTPSNLLLGQIVFGNYDDPQICASLLLFLRDQRAHGGTR